jgi:hypothetical protein
MVSPESREAIFISRVRYGVPGISGYSMDKRVLLVAIPFLLVVVVLLRDRGVFAQQVPRQVPDLSIDTSNHSPSPQATRSGHTAIEIALSLGVLVFGAVIISLEILVMLKRSMYWDIWSFKILGLTLVIVAGLFLIVAGYSQNQAAPMMGLLGTVAGYLLGKEGAPASSTAPPAGGSASQSGP